MKIKEDTINNLENYFMESYDVNIINTPPQTEDDLLRAYYGHSDILYQYIRLTVNSFVDPLFNEIRAMLGHCAAYRLHDPDSTKRDLEKAYGHFRRFNLDALKILCNEFDKSLALQFKKQYNHDYRNVYSDYLRDYGTAYFKAKKLYINAQFNEQVGSDSLVHNVFSLYYEAAKEYIHLKQFYQSYKSSILKAKRIATLKKVLIGIGTGFGIIVSLLDALINFFVHP